MNSLSLKRVKRLKVEFFINELETEKQFEESLFLRLQGQHFGAFRKLLKKEINDGICFLIDATYNF